MSSIRPGVRLAVDWGDARIGVAACDADGVLAYPLTTVAAGADEIADLAALVGERAPIEVLVGLPRSLQWRRGAGGGEGPGTRWPRWPRALGVPVRLVDERLTTVTAVQRLRAGGKTAEQQRAVIDAAAAAAILEQALAVERAGSTRRGS